jgi:tRNA(Arg) A34 adenosine deaminase TadA|tara:strand:+ start:1748 stop:2182 length:435 start_codon:yes stop_codon:yes gene_type:complete
MELALDQARFAMEQGEVPVGAVIIDTNNCQAIAQAFNRIEKDKDPTAHAELLVIREATIAYGKKWLENCDMYVTLEPCAMCAAAISLARIRRIYFAAYDPKSGGVEHGAKIFEQITCHHKPEVIGGINELEAAQLLRDFFKNKR